LEQLLQHDYKTNVRELGSMLAMATLDCNGTYLESSELLAFDRRLSALTLPPASSAAKAWWLSVEENLRLELLRKHRFSPTSCGRDSAYRGNRQTADLHLRHLICKALDAGNWDAQAAARLLAGEDETLVEKCQSRVQTFLSNLEERVSKMPADELDRALADDWKGLLDAVLPVIVRLRAQRRVSEASPDNAPH
jgi:DNA-binding NtrC family response regulator